MSELLPAVPPRTSLSPQREFHPFSSPARTSIPLWLRAIWSHSVEAMTARWMTACHWRLQMRRSCWAHTTTLSPCILRSPAYPAQAWMPIFSGSCLKLGLEWSPPEETSHSRLDEWFLPGRRQAPRQQASPFFPEVHNEITKSWRAPYSCRLRASSSSALISKTNTCGFDTIPLAGRQKPPTADP